MTATQTHSATTSATVLYVAFELGWNEWKLAFSTGLGQAPRLRSIGARRLNSVLREIGLAKERFGLPADAPVRSCYEAGRDGFWLHRWLTAQGVANLIVDAASIEVNRRYRRVKNDRLDASKLASMLWRYHQGEKVWSVVRVPSPQEEDQRHAHRDLGEMVHEQTQHVNRIKGLLAGVGISLGGVTAKFSEEIAELRTWDEQPLTVGLRERLLREYERLAYVRQQISALQQARNRAIRDDDTTPYVQQVRKLLSLRAIGPKSAWLFVLEIFGWRRIRNRRELAALHGLTPTPYASGASDKEQGISKAGNKRVRTMTVEIARVWLQWQPQSALAEWYRRRFGGGSSRHKRIGIVALARRLLVALWRWLEKDEVPARAELVDWRKKVTGPASELMPI